MPVCLNPTYFSDTPPKKSRKRRAAALRSNLARTAKARQPGLSARICPRSLPPRSAMECTVLTGELQHYRSAGPCRRGKRARSGASSRRAARAAGGNGQSPGGTASHGAAGRPGRGQRAEQPGDKTPTFSRLGAPPVLPAVPRRASPRTPAAVRPRCSRRSAAAMLPSRPAGRFRFRQMGRRAARLRRAPPVGVEETTRLPARQHRAYRGGSVGRRLLAGRTRLCGWGKGRTARCAQPSCSAQRCLKQPRAEAGGTTPRQPSASSPGPPSLSPAQGWSAQLSTERGRG